MSWMVTAAVKRFLLDTEIPELKTRHAAVLYAVADESSDAFCSYPSFGRIARACRMTRRSVIRCLNDLQSMRVEGVEAPILTITHRQRTSGADTSNLFVINLPHVVLRPERDAPNGGGGDRLSPPPAKPASVTENGQGGSDNLSPGGCPSCHPGGDPAVTRGGDPAVTPMLTVDHEPCTEPPPPVRECVPGTEKGPAGGAAPPEGGGGEKGGGEAAPQATAGSGGGSGGRSGSIAEKLRDLGVVSDDRIRDVLRLPDVERVWTVIAEYERALSNGGKAGPGVLVKALLDGNPIGASRGRNAARASPKPASEVEVHRWRCVKCGRVIDAPWTMQGEQCCGEPMRYAETVTT